MLVSGVPSSADGLESWRADESADPLKFPPKDRFEEPKLCKIFGDWPRCCCCFNTPPMLNAAATFPAAFEGIVVVVGVPDVTNSSASGTNEYPPVFVCGRKDERNHPRVLIKNIGECRLLLHCKYVCLKTPATGLD